MRTLFVLLLLANLTLFGYIQLDNVERGESERLGQQINAEKIRLLTPAQYAALAPDKAAQAPVCAEWGPFADADRARAMADLDALGAARLASEKRSEGPSGYWAFIAPFPSRAAAERRLADLRAAGVQDVSVVDTGGQRFAISLGVFRTEDAAAAHTADLARRGVANVRSGPRPAASGPTSLVVRDPPATVLTRLREIQGNYPGADLRVGTCDRTP